MSKVHTIAQTGFGTGTNDLYDRARPSYQTFALDAIFDSLKNKQNLNVLEIGAGTGIFTRALLAHPRWNSAIASLRAIEPSGGMREVFNRTVNDPQGRISIHDGTFQDTGVEEGWADVVLIAQAYHWCPDYEAASVEFGRVLKENGTVGFIWNLEDRDGAPWVAQLRDTIEVHEKGTPQFRHMYWRATFSTPSYQSLFCPPVESTWTYTLHGTKESVVDRASSKSYIAVLEKEEKEKVQERIRQIIDEADKTWVDKEKGVFEYPYKCWVVVAQKK
ncbi:S-adenosyl-L-methionine-dependent methyltransferase [Panaeolus papilionaceus]|nr:S-adenosyl-L-methionine-dependent methyltransferase [Panaeolus papilionaceus]